MSLFTVPVLTLREVSAHPNADALDLARVGGFHAVVGKGAFAAGDRVAYLPTDSVIPGDVAEALGIAAHLKGSDGNRISAIKLRGIISEGIVLPIATVRAVVVARGGDAALVDRPDVDLAPALGITKYEPPVAPEMLGRIRPWPSFLSKYNIENIKRPEFADLLPIGLPVQVTEKRHGSCMCVAVGPGMAPDERAIVTSAEIAILEDDTNDCWRTVAQHDLVERLLDIRAHLTATGIHVESLGLYGETLGGQDLKYGADKGAPGFEAFDLMVNAQWLDAAVFRSACLATGTPVVPVLYEGPYDPAAVAAVAEGPASDFSAHVREGVVIRPLLEQFDPRVGRVIFKLHGDGFLGRRGKKTSMR